MKARDRFLPTVKGRQGAGMPSTAPSTVHRCTMPSRPPSSPREDVPSAWTEVVAIKKTPTGRWTMTVRRTLGKEIENAWPMGAPNGA